MRKIIKKDLFKSGYKLCGIGYRLSGTGFVKKTKKIKEIINIYGSAANENIFDTTREFFIDINIYNKNTIISHIRVPNLPSIDKPQKYDDYYIRDINEDDDLTIEQRQEIWNYTGNLSWRYNMNIESIILEKAKYMIMNYGIKYLDEMEKLIFEDDEIQKETIKEIYNKIFYWAIPEK
jgi:hypothetical protein